ncbi:MAG TPA: cysteine desulfurase, partial [Lachnospiraceae bacterium]|nr:cysteine desulfurase [Lachnospiraceae bacterium]
MTAEERKAEDLRIRRDFPLIYDHPEIAYLDNAATTQKPDMVLRAVENYYREDNANPLRGLYELSQRATAAYEDAREKVRGFINARTTREIVFTRNASESLNLAAFCWSERYLQEGDEVLITIMEHHSNLLPWMQACKRKGAVLKYLEVDESGIITEEMFRRALSEKTKMVAMTQISNVLGVKNDIRKFAAIAHERGAFFAADGAQSVPHIPVDVQELDVDFLAFS